MLTRTKHSAAAVLATAAAALGIALTGCVTPQRIDRLEEQIKVTQRQNIDTQNMLRNIDTTVAGEAADNRRLRADLSVTIDQLQMQIDQLQQNYSDLLQRIDELYNLLEAKGQLRSSSGAVTPPGPLPGTAPATPPAAATPDAECGTMYDDAFVLVRRAEHEQAIQAFQAFLTACPSHELAENAYYWIGESYYSLGKYPEAIAQLELLLKTFKASPNTSRALFKLGRSQEELGKKKEARQTFQRLVDDHPGTLEAEQAKERLKNL
ncbi:MAG TPA: tol-pal system protein YbgF [candidate division Zixibacteria bacterium]|nr:tol-pal system protein YbgF [candidate division Zixibacteria bacterium]MDD4918026.1 tol-pal system protein YbgF [candidate division Zixibacteria bacterium]MDM7974107.1 tol-pal system protein YbgF [candidate division Zixibacteria bacterium]HOD66870.1 tol-pal system protein YbgF [candidate division Zixibacteria bacterium]HPM37456.1 tol-pal system protein YbgF [candidate division Zixibacteria bacterium]